MNTWLSVYISSEKTVISMGIEDIRNILVKGREGLQ